MDKIIGKIRSVSITCYSDWYDIKQTIECPVCSSLNVVQNSEDSQDFKNQQSNV